jgi:hypothetical protein
VLEFPLPSSCSFFLHFFPPCNIFLLLWLFFAIGSIHQEFQAVKFNYSCTSGFADCSCLLPSFNSIVSCTSGLLRLQLSSANFQVQMLAVLPDYSGYNCFLCFSFHVLRLFFLGGFILVINIQILSLSNSISTKYLEIFIFDQLILKIAILSSQSSKLTQLQRFSSVSRLFNELPTLINNFKANYLYIKFQV